MTSHGLEYLSTIAPPPRLAPTTGRRPKPCATAQERARQLYRQMWFQANRGRIKGSPSPREEAARAWLAALKQAKDTAKPSAKKRTRRKISNEGEAEERDRQQCRAYYLRHRATILAERRAFRARPEVKAARLAKYQADHSAARAAALAAKTARRASWAAAPPLSKADLKKLSPDERRRARQRQAYRKRMAATATAPAR